MICVTILIFITIILTIVIGGNSQDYMEIKLIVNLMILGVQGVVLRQYITNTSWFLNNMKQSFHYEYQKHVVRETLT